ncbi:MAG: hypothetical protein CSA21_04270 [Deltaproteobacteria bacterium]|nr:MAG: hypothetical protein CSA21_04270 [Deltaproteobacteria bacterium]
MSNKECQNSSMDQVRELLMGTHLKDMGIRMKRQEEMFLREIAKLRDDMQNRVDSLENFMKNEFASLLRRLQEEKDERSSLLKNEHRERTEAIRSERKERFNSLKEEKKDREQAFKSLEQDLASKEKEIERKFVSVSSSLDASEKGLRELVLSEYTRLTQTLEERYQKVMERLANTDAQIRHDVVARSQISAMFAEAAVRFSESATEIEDPQKYTKSTPAEKTPAQTEGKNES